MGVAFLLPLNAAAASTQAASRSTGSLTQTITNDPATVNGASGLLNGTLTITKFVAQQGQLQAVGTLTGTITNSSGQILATLTSVPVTALISSATGTCQILYLHTGEITLNLLGLMIDISPITINITANPSGGLLGQLLCDIANLLNNGTPLVALTGLLNQVLAAL